MGNINNTSVVLSNQQLAGPRLNKNFIDTKSAVDNDKNLLLKETQILQQRRDDLVQKYKQVDLHFKRNSNEKENATISDYPRESLDNFLPFVEGKTLSYEMLLNVVARRFHSCLLQESQQRPQLADQLGDIELVQTVCKRERLTLMNFLKEHATAEQSTEEALKQQIVREYGIYFPRKDQKPGTARDINIYQDQSSWGLNTLNNKFKVEFS